MKLDVLAIGSHPDDVELTCGGTIAKLVKRKRAVGILDLTEGELGTRGSREVRRAEATRAAEILGVSFRENLKIADGNIEADPENRLKLVTVLREYRPEVILMPYWSDRHPDHERSYVLCREAWFAAGLEKVPTTFQGSPQAPHRPRAYYHYMQWNEFIPSFIVDVTNEYDQRVEAMHAYRSQFYDPESKERGTVLSTPDFLEMVRTRLEYYGDKIGKKYGEPFFSSAPLKVDDLFTLNT
jgi:bacillithiol biosynthesis deacetylase BshB1